MRMILLLEERLRQNMLLTGILCCLHSREENEEKELKKPLASNMLKSDKTTLSLESSPSFKATKVVLDDDSFLDSIDISELEKDLQ